MLSDTSRLPVTKTRDIHNHHMDSTAWDRFNFRDDDIVIATYAKSGTTWMQQIVSQLIFDGEDDAALASARAAWAAVKAQGLEATYWQCDEAGRWQRKA